MSGELPCYMYGCQATRFTRIIPQVHIVACIAEGNVIGRGGAIPWHVSGDLRHFKSLTVGKTVIMGANTYRSIGETPLGNRMNIVLSKNSKFEPRANLLVCGSLVEALMATEPWRQVFVIGGQSVYEQAIEYADYMHITELRAEYAGDTFFPEFDATEWREHDRSEFMEGDLEYSVVVYRRLRGETFFGAAV